MAPRFESIDTYLAPEMDVDPVLETERLSLRRLTEDDVECVLGILSDPTAMQYYPRPLDRRGAEAWVAGQIERYRVDGHGLYAAERRDTGEFVGQIGLVLQNVHGVRETEIGYLLLRRHWGQGYATEAARACRDHGFQAMGRDRLVSLIDPRNQPSRRVADRMGMSFEGMIELWNKSICVYAISRPDSQ